MFLLNNRCSCRFSQRHINALRRVHGRGPPFVAVIGYHGQEENASIFYKKSAFLPCSSRRAAASRPNAAGSSHRLPPVRPISHSTRPPRASAVVPPAQQAMRSAAEGPASHAAARYSARPPSRGRKDADPQLPPPGPQQPQHQQVSQLVERRGGEDHRQQLPAVHQCEPGRQQPEAAGNPNPVTPARHSRWDLGTGCPHGARSADEARWPRRSPPPLQSRPPPSQRRLRRR